jgi:hypothetical protein
LELFIQYAYRGDVVPIQSEARAAAHKFLIKHALVKIVKGNSLSSQPSDKFEVTDKGQFFLDHIKSIPVPIEVVSWQIPSQSI